jgi:hypothetical protein
MKLFRVLVLMLALLPQLLSASALAGLAKSSTCAMSCCAETAPVTDGCGCREANDAPVSTPVAPSSASRESTSVVMAFLTLATDSWSLLPPAPVCEVARRGQVSPHREPHVRLPVRLCSLLD